MTTDKINGFAAPYRSLTFRKVDDALVGRSGLLKLNGLITETGGDVTVPGLSFIQKGLVVTTDEIQVIAIPTSLIEPYYLTVRASSVFRSSPLIYGFARTPEEISDELVIVAEKVNGQWRPFYEITVDEIIKTIQQDRVDFGFARVLEGLTTQYSAPNLVTQGGTVIDKAGQKHLLEGPLEGPFRFTPLDADKDFARVDRLVFRRPLDADARIGRIEQLLGGTFSDAAQTTQQTSIFGTATNPVENSKAVILDDNSVAIIAAEGFGSTYQLKYTRYSSDRTTELVALTTVVSATSGNFDVLINDGVVYLAYQDGNTVKLVLVNQNTGAQVAAPFDVSSGLEGAKNPSVTALPNGEIAIAYEEFTGPTSSRIMLAKKSATGSTVLAPVELQSGSDLIGNVSIFATEDFVLHVAYENITQGLIFFARLDDIGNTIDAFADISSSTTYGANTLAGNASSPMVKVASNKQVFVGFLQERTGGEKGLAIYTKGKAVLADLIGATEDFTSFDFEISEIFNTLNILTTDTANGVHFTKYLTAGSYDISLQVDATAAQSVFLTLDKHGSLFHLWTAPNSGSFTPVGGSSSVQNIGPQAITGGVGSVSLLVNQYLVLVADAPTLGRQATITGTSGGANDLVSVVTGLETNSLNGTDDVVVVTLADNFSGTPESSPGTNSVSYANPDANGGEFVKSVSEIRQRAYVVAEQETDILLSRVLQPGNVVLNYIPGNGAQSDSDTLGIFGNAQIGWEAPNAGELVITGTTSIIDFINNLQYDIAGGTFVLAEDDAIYVVLDGEDLTPTIQVAQIDEIDWNAPLQVLGFIKGGSFYPKFLAAADVGKIAPGEEIIIGDELSTTLKNRLGIVNDTTFSPYPNANIIDANDSYPDAIGKLDNEAQINRNNAAANAVAKLVRGGTWFWDEANDTLSYSADAFIQYPGFIEDRNRLRNSDGPITLANDGDVAIVTLNRLNDATTNLVVTVGQIDALTVNQDTFVIARRVGDDVHLSSGLRLAPGERIEMDAVLEELNRFLRRLDLQPVPGNAKRVRITPPQSDMLDGSRVGQVINNLMLDPLFEAQIDPVTGDIFKGDGTTPINGVGTNPLFTAPTIAASQFRWFGVSLVPLQVNAIGQIEASVLVLPAIADGASAATASLEGAVLGGELPIGWFYVQRNAADDNIEDITFANITRVPVSGGSGGGSGSASDFIQDMKDQLTSSIYNYGTATQFSQEQDAKVDDTSQGTYSFADRGWSLETGQQFLSINLLTNRFYTQRLKDVSSVDITVRYKANIDPAATYEISSDGGANWETVDIGRIGESDTFVKSNFTFDDSGYTFATIVEFALSEADGVVELNDGSTQLYGQEFTTPADDYWVARNIEVYLNKIGSPEGYFFTKIVADDAGNPSLIGSDVLYISPARNIADFANGDSTLSEIIPFGLLKPNTKYHILFETDTVYKASFDAGVDALNVRVDSSSPLIPDIKAYDESTFSAVSGSAAVYKVEGRELDLRLRITASQDTLLDGYGVLYDPNVTSARTQNYPTQLFYLNGDDNVLTLAITEFNLNVDTLVLSDINTGQAWVWPAFGLSGNNLIFPSGAFEKPGEQVILKASLFGGGSFANDDNINTQLAENYVWSGNPSQDKSLPGRGPTYRTESNDLIEVGFDASGFMGLISKG